MENYELIENYFEGKLSEEEKASVDSLLLSNSDFKDEFELYKNIVSGIKEAGKEHLKNKLKEADIELDSASIVIERGEGNSYLKIFAVAASVVLIIGVSIFYFFIKSPDYSALATKFYEPEKGLPVEMGITNNPMDKVMNDFNKGDFIGAKGKLEKIPAVNSNDTISYFLGVVSYELKDYKEAIADFKRVNTTSNYLDKSQYRLVLCYLKTSKKDEALNGINEALQNKENKFYDKLLELRTELTK